MVPDSDLKKYQREQELLFEELEAREVADQADEHADALVEKLVDFYFSSRWCPPGLNYGRSEMEDAHAVYNDALRFLLKSKSWRLAEPLAARIRKGFEWKVWQKSRRQEDSNLDTT